ncbi:MAG: biotin transporter BioY [bacterium]
MLNAMTAVLKKEIVMSKTTQRVLLTLLFSYLTFCAALIKIYTPLSVIPFTTQTFVLFMAMYFLNPKEAGISQALYIVAGLIGAPVFAVGITGALALVGPTAGYLAGFVISAVVMAYLMSKTGKLSYIKAALIFSLGALIVLTFGTLNLILVYKMPVGAALMAGFLPFAGIEVVKIFTAAGFFGLKNNKQ